MTWKKRKSKLFCWLRKKFGHEKAIQIRKETVNFGTLSLILMDRHKGEDPEYWTPLPESLFELFSSELFPEATVTEQWNSDYYQPEPPGFVAFCCKATNKWLLLSFPERPLKALTGRFF